MKKWMALVLALVAVLTLVACGNTEFKFIPPLQPEEGWGTAKGYQGKILGIWYNIEENAGDETVYGFNSEGVLLFAENIDAEEARAVYYTVDEDTKTVSIYEQNNKQGEASFEEQLGKLRATFQIVENNDTIYLIGENDAGEPCGMAREADLETARTAYPEIAKPNK